MKYEYNVIKKPKYQLFDLIERAEKMSTTVKDKLIKKNDLNIKRLTGFASERALLGYICIVYNADISIIKKRSSVLTWFKE